MVHSKRRRIRTQQKEGFVLHTLMMDFDPCADSVLDSVLDYLLRERHLTSREVPHMQAMLENIKPVVTRLAQANRKMREGRITSKMYSMVLSPQEMAQLHTSLGESASAVMNVWGLNNTTALLLLDMGLHPEKYVQSAEPQCRTANPALSLSI